jgi:uncharacterized protein YbgA (DUF1722 family)
MSQIPVQKQVFDKNIYPRVIDTQFSQLINQQVEEEQTFTLDEFFELYEQLFYQIPKEGEINSHQYILEKTAEYLGVNLNQDDIQALLDEITNLRQQVLDSQSTITEIENATQTNSING